MTSTAKVRALVVRPTQSSDLCFSVSGIIGSLGLGTTKSDLLGSRVSAIDIDKVLISKLSLTKARQQNPLFCESITDPQARKKCIVDHSSFIYTPEEIINELSSHVLFSLRNGPLRSALKQSIHARARVFLEKYHAVTFIEEQTQKYFNDQETGRLPLLAKLAKLLKDKFDALAKSYKDKSHPEVVTEYDSTQHGLDSSTASTRSVPTGTAQVPKGETKGFLHPATVPGYVKTREKDIKDASGNVTGKETYAAFENFNTSKAAKDKDIVDTHGFLLEATTTTKDFDGKSKQWVTTDLTEFRTPALDSSISYVENKLQQAMEEYNQSVESVYADYMSEILLNELSIHDLDVRTLQHKFLQTLLVAPISGIVTAIYKDPGDYVKAGEPVMRIENDDALFLVGRIQSKVLVTVGQQVRVKTVLSENVNKQEDSYLGDIRVIRGHSTDDDEWEVIIYCDDNTGLSSPKLPLNYHFDPDSTTVELL